MRRLFGWPGPFARVANASAAASTANPLGSLARRLWLGTALLTLAVSGSASVVLLAAPQALPASRILILAPPDQPRRSGPAEVTPVVLAKLMALSRRSPYGRLGSSGKDFVSAWTWSYAGRSAVRLHALTGDARLIQALLAAWARYEEAGSVYAGIDGYGWYTHTQSTGWRTRDAPIAGLIIHPIVELLLEAERSPELARLIAPDRARLLATVRRGIDGLDNLYLEDANGGWLMNRARRGPEPTNLMAAYAVPLLGLSLLTSETDYARQFDGVARTFKRSLRQTAGGTLGWPYFARPEGLTHKPDPVHKTPGNIELVMAGYRAGRVFTAGDIGWITQAFTDTVIVPAGSGRIAIRQGMDGASPWLSIDGAEARAKALQLGGWYALSCAARASGNSDPADLLDRVLPVLDPNYARNLFVIAGLTERWLEEADPSRCEPRPTSTPGT